MFKAGTVDGAMNVPSGELFNADGTFKGREEVAALFAKCGVDPEKPLVFSCGSGVATTVMMTALRNAGFPEGKNYDGSFAEWKARN